MAKYTDKQLEKWYAELCSIYGNETGEYDIIEGLEEVYHNDGEWKEHERELQENNDDDEEIHISIHREYFINFFIDQLLEDDAWNALENGKPWSNEEEPYVKQAYIRYIQKRIQEECTI